MGVEPGTYYIRNIEARDLAVQYGGRHSRLSVAKGQNQKWTVSGDHENHTKPQSIIPQPSQDFQSYPLSHFVELKKSEYQWFILTLDGISIILDMDRIQLWNLDEVQPDAYVTLRGTKDANHPDWEFIKAE